MQQVGIDGQTRVVGHPGRGAVDESVAVRAAAPPACRSRRRRTRAVGKRSASARARPVARSTSTSTTVRCSVPSESRASATAATRAPGPELDHLAHRRTRQAGAEGGGEAAGVGVVADRAALAEDHGVDRAQPGRPLVEGVQVLHHQLLARVGDVEGVEAEGAGRPDQGAHLGRGDPQRGDVDGPVDVVQSEGPSLGHVQRWGERRPDAGSDEPDQERLLRHLAPFERRRPCDER